MKLKQLIRGIEGIEVRGSREIEITGLCADSRVAAPGNLFIARKGKAHDGGQFIGKALDAGAVAVAHDLYDPFLKATQIISRDPGKLEASLAARYYGRPSEELFVVGVTGTKGKTTTTYLMGVKSGLVGTVETIIGETRVRSPFTTHYPIQNQKLLREMVAKECQSAVMEVSSHGLDQGRTDEISFDIGLFTNLYPDHLDYHPTVEEYAAAKRKLFKNLKGTAILNSDSPWSEFMQGGEKRVSYGIENKADVQARDIRFSEKGTEFRVGDVLFSTPLMGRFNVYNLLGAIAVCLERGFALEEINAVSSTFKSVPGRLESVPNDRGFRIFVDFAHSGEALKNVLGTLKEIAKKRVIVVFGCGGNRDAARRSGMGEAAEGSADLSVVTSDNPRAEDPEEIIRQILAGYKNPEKALVEVDRTKAIGRAIALGEPGDIVLIAGKGHEKTQIFAHQTIPYDDVEVAKEALQKSATSDILSTS